MEHEEVDIMHCRKCGADIRPGDRLCDKCVSEEFRVAVRVYEADLRQMAKDGD